jgi:phosphoglycerate dehydrogenase-like enzyme
MENKLLINLPPSFFTTPSLEPHFARLASLASVRSTSYNTPDEIAQDLRWADAVLMWSWPVLDTKMLRDAGGLTFLGQINTTGTTARACLELGIPHSEVRHCWSPAVAEMALTLMLAGLRKTSAFHIQMRTATEPWVKEFPADIDPMERQLTGRTVGIVGFGGIGRRLAELLRPFEVDLLVHDPFIPADVVKSHNGRLAPLQDLITNADVLVLCAANVEGAQHLLDSQQIAALKPGCVLVNVGRSMLINMQSLVERLRKGDITAMLDVFDKEPLEQDSVLRSLPNAFLTPHRAGGIMESVQRALSMLTDDLEAQMQGRQRQYAVTEGMLACFPD